MLGEKLMTPVLESLANNGHKAIFRVPSLLRSFRHKRAAFPPDLFFPLENKFLISHSAEMML
jgi:hypothetical protein